MKARKLLSVCALGLLAAPSLFAKETCYQIAPEKRTFDLMCINEKPEAGARITLTTAEPNGPVKLVGELNYERLPSIPEIQVYSANGPDQSVFNALTISIEGIPDPTGRHPSICQIGNHKYKCLVNSEN